MTTPEILSYAATFLGTAAASYAAAKAQAAAKATTGTTSDPANVHAVALRVESKLDGYIDRTDRRLQRLEAEQPPTPGPSTPAQ
jgi:hypothetical protein